MERQLESLTVETDTENIGVSYTYDMSGMRSSKTVVYGVGEAHSHEYTSSVTAPTCTTAGFTTYTCDCGESYVDNLVDALGHNYVQSGNVYTCSRCGDSYTGHEHSYTEATTEPTCLTAGYTVYTCSCGDSYTVDIPALGHNYVLVGQSGNVATYECSRCGHRYSAVIPVDPNPPVEYSLRSSNTVTEHHEYVYMSGLLVRETITTTSGDTTTTQVLDFIYGSGSTPLALVYTNGTASPVTYYYVTNMQGDVVKLVTASGVTVASYAYDAWGRITTATGSMAEVNPIRYRGYYYDAEVELYYLQSRYYDPAVKRFISADGMVSTGVGLVGYNMFSYCNNTPIMFEDAGGNKLEIINSDFDTEKDENGEVISEEITAIDLFVILCKLTDDVLYLDGNQVRILEFREGSRPVGTALVRELILSEQTVTIRDCGSIGVANRVCYPNDRTGDVTGSLVYLRWDSLHGDIPQEIYLAHELIHAWRFATIPGAAVPKKIELPIIGEISPEEYATVGPPWWWPKATYTENKIRREQGIGLRWFY